MISLKVASWPIPDIQILSSLESQRIKRKKNQGKEN